MARIRLDDPRYYFNRHESWLAFNRRVLEEALDECNPLLERVKFLAITASNLDEFVEVRVAGLLQQVEHGISRSPGPMDCRRRATAALRTPNFIPLWPRNTSAGTRSFCRPWRARASAVLSVASPVTGPAETRWICFYTRQVDPHADSGHDRSFPSLSARDQQSVVCRLPVAPSPAACDDLSGCGHRTAKTCPAGARASKSEQIDYIFLHDLVETHTRNLYKGYQVISSGAFRATRNSNLYLHEEESRNLLESVDTQLHNRRKGDVVRLEIEADAAAEIVDPLASNLRLQPWQVFKTAGPVNLSRLFSLAEQTARPDLKFQPFVSTTLSFPPKVSNLFEQMRKATFCLHHPYDSYEPVVAFIESAARDPKVLSDQADVYTVPAKILPSCGP